VHYITLASWPHSRRGSDGVRVLLHPQFSSPQDNHKSDFLHDKTLAVDKALAVDKTLLLTRRLLAFFGTNQTSLL
jgi:hypothetical protein